MQIELTFYGVRGTRTVTGKRFSEFGGETSCVGVRVVPKGDGAVRDGGIEDPVQLLFDGGTGIHAAGGELVGGQHPVTVFLSHLHHDHLAGLPFFAPLFEPNRPVQVYVPEGMSERLLAYFAPPYYPLTLDDLPAQVTVTELPTDGSVHCRGGGLAEMVPPRGHELKSPAEVAVHSLRLPGEAHPRDGVTLYSVETGDKRIVYASDFEWLRVSPTDQNRVLNFVRDADVFIVDAQYIEDEYAAFAGRGHNTVPTAVTLGQRAGVRRIVLFHHDPDRDDTAMEALDAQARGYFGLELGSARDQKPNDDPAGNPEGDLEGNPAGDNGAVVVAARQGMRMTL